jgi:2-polyprenyl-3-methyl-5-hydroxy-6-metoxy-1,4-benzoquinol methylase
MGVKEKSEPELYSEMKFCSCDRCGCVQLGTLIEPSILYKHPHNPAIGKTWESHNRLFADYVISTESKNILDVGGANMKIANMISESPTVDSYTVCDLSVGSYDVKQHPKIKTIKDYVENISDSQKYDAVVLSHTLEHFYEPIPIIKHLVDLLNKDGSIIVSVPNIEAQLQDGFLNALNFEHTYYISHEYINLIATICGLEVVDQKDFSKYNSFYIMKKKCGKFNFPKDVSKSKKVYENHIKTLLKDVANINFQTKNKQVYCFGAHIFTQMLIAHGLNINCIKGILDNDSDKIGRFLYGTNLMVYHPSVICEEHSPIVILRVSQYKNEIVDGLTEYNRGVSFI